MGTFRFSALGLVTSLLIFLPNHGRSPLATALLPEKMVACVHTPGTNDKCKDPYFALKSAPKEMKKEIERLGDVIAVSLPKAIAEEKAQIAKAKKDGEPKKRALFLEKSKADSALKECLRKYGLSTSSKNPRSYCSSEQFEVFLAESSYNDHELRLSASFNSGKYFDQWLSAWESLGILAKTFPQHINPMHLPYLLKGYDGVRSCKANDTCRLP